jgi:putative DNA primase/helicase
MNEADTTARNAAQTAGAGAVRPGSGPVSPESWRTDAGNADRFAARAGGRALYAKGQGWLVWDGMRWARDLENVVRREAVKTARSIHDEAAALNADAARATDADEAKKWTEQAKEAARWALTSESRSRIDGMVHLAEAHPAIVLAGGAASLDADPDALNVQNGILDLRTFELRGHDPAEHHTKVAGAAFEAGAASALWERFLERVIPSPELRLWVQKAAGSSLRGRHSEDLFIPWGSGKNGKSVFLHAVRHALGDYAMEAAPELLVRGHGKRNAGDNSAMADLRGRRFVTTIETGEGAQLDEVFVKQLTGEALMKAKHMRQDWFEFENQSSVWLATNHKPVVQGTDVAIWERLHLIPFTEFIPPAERDEALAEKLERPENTAAVLLWLVEGLNLFDSEGLRPAPAEVVEATEEYREEMDPISRWLEEDVEADPEGATPVAWVAESYSLFCQASGEDALPTRAFNESLKGRGFKQGTRRNVGGNPKPQKVWTGFRLVNEWHWTTPAPGSGATASPMLREETERAEPQGFAR